MSTTTFFGTLNHYTCPSCGVVYGLEAGFDANRRASGRHFYCPNGHYLSYHETAIDRAEKAARRAQELLESERRRHEATQSDLTAATNHLNAEKAAKSRLRNRAAAGVCPCCTRTFKQLAAHMKHQHPEFVESAKS